MQLTQEQEIKAFIKKHRTRAHELRKEGNTKEDADRIAYDELTGR